MTRLRAGAPRLRALAALLAALAAIGAGCTSVPREAVAQYTRAFDQARSSAEDVLLTARASAAVVADHPDNPALPSARLAELRLAEDAVEARLLALRVVDSYNDALLALAVKSDPASIEASVQGLLGSLEALNLSAFSSLAAAAGPYGAAIGLGVALIEDLVRQRHFREAVEAGEPIVMGILDVLIRDVEDLRGVIGGQRFLLPRARLATETRLKATSVEQQVRNSDPDARPVADVEMAALVDRYAAARARAGEPPRTIPLAPVPAPAQGDAAAIAKEKARRIALAPVLAGLEANVTQYEDMVARLARLDEEARAYAKVLDEHRALLRAVAVSLGRVRSGLDERGLAPAVDLAAQVLRLRQALITARLKERGE